MEIKLSLIIPIYNAVAFIDKTLISLKEWAQRIDYSVQIILVNDGSTDDTRLMVEKFIEMNKTSIELLTYETNQGKGYAVKKGMLAAVGKFKIFTDADIPFGFDIVDKMLHYLDFKEFDVVIGDRMLEGAKYVTEISQIRKVGSSIFSFIVGRFVAGGHFDTQCGLKGFRDIVANDLFEVSKIRGFAFDVELLYISIKRNYDIKRIPVILVCQEGSTVKVVQHGIGMLFDLFKIKGNHLRGEYKTKIN